MSKVKEFYYKQLEDDREFELGYLEYLYQLDQDSTAIESDKEKLLPLSKKFSFHTDGSLPNYALNNKDYNPIIGA